ncbi:MAG: N-acetyltransferase [Chloroflexia bacterium]|nr:N-acetyltransferase [Chloroflexia bacterium]
MPSGSIQVKEIPLGDPQIKEFADLPWSLYERDPHWTPPLRMDLLGNRLLGTAGILTPQHPYHEHAEVTHFLAQKDGEPVGRVSAAINRRYNEYHDTKIGFFGFFETVNDFEVARSLLDQAKGWAQSRGMRVLRGPGEYSNATHERQGVLVDGFDHPPTVELTHNPPYYGSLLERYGFAKAKDYYAYTIDLTQPLPDRLKRVAERVRQRREIETRPVVLKELQAEVRMVIDIYNEAWAQNWGFLPITEGEADALAETLKPIIDPGLVRLAYIDGEAAAVLGAFPDPNYALRPRWSWYGDSDPVRIARLLWMRRRIPRMRLMFFGVRPKFRRLGADALLYDEVSAYALEQGYRECETSMLLENNELILRASAFFGGQHYKTWRIYDLPLESNTSNQR